MAGILPLVHNGNCCQYPVTRRVEFATDVAQAINASEQRARLRPPLTTIILPFNRVPSSDFTNMKNFFESQKGPFSNDWSAVIGKRTVNASISGTTFDCSDGTFTDGDVGADVVDSTGVKLARITALVNPAQVTIDTSVTYSGDARWGYYVHHLTLEAMEFAGTEHDGWPLLYNFTIRARQTQNPGVITAATGGTFPTFSWGGTAELPASFIQRFQVAQNNNAFGPNYSYTWFGGSLAGFPTASLPGWEITFPFLSDVDLRTLEDFFYAQWGRYGLFSYVDPHTTITYTNCRFDSDLLEVRHEGYNRNSTAVRIVRTF